MLINAADEIFLSICYLYPIADPAVLKNNPYLLGSGVAGFFVWCGLLGLIRFRHWKTAEFFRNISHAGVILLCVGILSVISLFACIQGFYLEEMPPNGKRISVLFCIIVVIIMIAVFLYLGNVVMRKQYLEDIKEANRNYLNAESAYLELTKSRYEELKGFRHDIKGHIMVMELLIQDGKYDRLQEYINRIQDEQILRNVNYTDNIIVDSIIQDEFGSYMDQSDWDVSFMGKMPEDVPMDEMDLCILISNALRNAREELEQCERKIFRMEIKQNDEEYCIMISNSVRSRSKDIDIERTAKKDTENHGYGIRNMRKAVENNNGQISWNVQGEMMTVTVYLPKKNKK